MALELDVATDPLAQFPDAQRAVGPHNALTPAEIIAQENATETGNTVVPPTETQTEENTEGQVTETPVLIGKVNVDELVKKVEAKTPLNAEEAEAYRLLMNPPPPPPEATFKINGEEFKRSEILEKAKEKYGLQDIATEKAYEDKLVSDYVKAENQTVATVTINKRHEQNAAERKLLDEQRIRQREEQVRLDTKRDLLEQRAQELETKKAALLKLAQSTITKDTVQDEDQRFELHEKIRAERELQGIATEEQKLVSETKELNRQTAFSMVRGLQVAQPVYATSEDISTLAAKMKKGETVSAEDRMKVLELDQLLRAAMEAESTIEDQYNLRMAQGNLAVPKLRRTAQPSASGSELPAGNSQGLDLNNSQSLAERVRQLKEKTLKNPDLIGGGGTGGDANRGQVGLTAEKLVRMSQEAAGQSRGDDRQRLKDLGLEGY